TVSPLESKATRDTLPAHDQLGSVLPPTEQVHVDVVDQLATTTAYVHPETISLRHNIPLRCQVFDDQEELAHQDNVLLLQVVHAGNMQLWNHQDMHGRLWVDVFKGH